MPCLHRIGVLMLVVTIALVSLFGLDTDAKRKRHRHDRHRQKPSQTVEIQSATVPWALELQVHVRFRGPSEWKDYYRNVTVEMNRLTASMPQAPEWVFVDEPEMSCRQMYDRELSGINICGEETDDNYLWPRMRPAGGAINGNTELCGDLAAAGDPGPHKAPNPGMADGWVTRIAFEATFAPTAGCYDVLAAGQGLAFHEMGHAWLGMPHQADSTTGGVRPWGPADFAKAEEWFGQSTVPFCDIYPEGYGCPGDAMERDDIHVD